MPNVRYPSAPILLVDDEKDALLVSEMALRCMGVTNVLCCQDSRQAMALVAEHRPSVAILDLLMPHVSGQELLRAIVQEYPEVSVIVVTGLNDLDTAIECMRGGAVDYMVKPVEENRMASAVRRAIEVRELQRECTRLRESLLGDLSSAPDAFASIVTQSPAMKTLFRYVDAVAKTPRPILITGETGVGKELFARAIHALSDLPGAFVAVNVAGLDDNLFSDTLFGHRKGAFTGAFDNQRGLVETAQGGTLFLDEIGELGPVSQVKLLRLIQEGEYFALGSTAVSRASVRIVAATNCDLDGHEGAGRFRKDLYYRLQTHRIHIPPLRKRPEDLPLLLRHFIEKASQVLGKKPPQTPPELVSLLALHDFPGNVRELEAMVFDAVSNHKGGALSLRPFREYLGLPGKGAQSTDSAEPAVSASEMQTAITSWTKLPTIRDGTRILIDEALRRTNNNQSMAAGLLGIAPPSLNRRLKRRV